MISQVTVDIAAFDVVKSLYVLGAEADVDGVYRRLISVFQHIFTDDGGQQVTFIVQYVP